MNAPHPWLENIWKRLTQLSQVPPQALLLTGAHGRGKADLANAYAGYLLNGIPEKHPDFLSITLIDDEKSISVDTIRELVSFTQQRCQMATRKVIVINPVEKLTLAAQQAFLKILEEPVVTVTYLLLTHQPEKLLPTVRSRCQVLHLKPVPYVSVKDWLREKGFEMSEEVYRMSGESPFIAISGKSENALYYEIVSKIKSTQDKLLQRKYFEELDVVQSIAKNISENPGINVNMQLLRLNHAD